MTTEMYNHCILCNAEVNWLEVEFRSEQNEPIKGLKVTITNPSTMQTHQKSASQGHVVFDNIAAGEWVVSVQTDNLLSTVEQYESRKEGEESPVKGWSDEQLDRDQSPKAYYEITAGDLWDTLPEDDFLKENHGPLRTNYREDARGFRTCHNRACVLEIKALRSYIPMIVDTDEFSLVNSYTFALLSQLAYASDKFGIPDDKNPSLPEGGIKALVEQLKLKVVPLYCASTKEDWLLSEVPYSQHLKAQYYHDSNIGAEGYLLSNDDVAIIGVRGTQTYFGNQEIGKLSKKSSLKIVDRLSAAPVLKITEGVDGIVAALNSPGYQDIATDINASQIAPEEFGGTYVHQGFYQYVTALLKLMDKDLELHKNRKFYVCGHSLGGAGALLLSARIQDVYSPSTLRLYTYGMPRTGTHSFVSRYSDIQHYRHANNHDLVPQIPMRWMNTNPNERSDSSSLWKYFFPVFALWDSLKERTMDSDDDNYQHHGNLIQLLTYSQVKHQPDDVKQVLLTEKQTHISSLTLASNKAEDSYRLANTLSKDYIDINGYIDSITHSGMDHFLSEYIPNIKQQVLLLLNEGSVGNYQSSLQAINNTERLLLDAYHELKMDEVNTLAQQHFSRKDPAGGQAQRQYERSQALFKIRQEIKLTEKITLNVQRVRKELEALVKTPTLLPADNLLFGDQASDKQKVKAQLL
ncbi:lipase [Vibrio kasasachensis]|uniref:lipase family protein n=1 Tax=Vibrio kasasachensis TaxID=2910248 RepID=UPI003D100711